MKLVIDLPDWCSERHIYIFAGMELAAYQYAGQPMRVKVDQCHQCGGCCTGLGEVSSSFSVVCPHCQKEHPVYEAIDGTCVHLGQDGPDKRPCSLGSGRPFACSAGIRCKNVDGCTEEFKEVE